MKWGGLYRGIVIEDDETKDPEYTGALTGRIKVVVPEIHKFDYEGAVRESGDNPDRLLQKIIAAGEGFWARACFPWGTKDMGDWYIPPKNAGVWIMFEAGLPSFPVWVGVWRTVQKRMTLPSGLDKEYIVKRTKWHLIEIKDKTGEEEFHYKNLKNNFELTVNKDGRLTISGPEQLTVAVTSTTTFTLSDNFTVNLGSKKMVVNAASAEICGTTALALKSDVDNIKSWLSSFISAYNNHTNGGYSLDTPFSTSLPTIAGTTKLKGS